MKKHPSALFEIQDTLIETGKTRLNNHGIVGSTILAHGLSNNLEMAAVFVNPDPAVESEIPCEQAA